MSGAHSSPFQLQRFCLFALLSLLLVGCSAPVPRPTGVAYEWQSAKEMFQKGRPERALEFTDDLDTASPPNAYTARARVLRVAIFSGLVKANKELVDAYGKGEQATENARFKGDFARLRHDYLQYGSRAALGLAEVANRLTEGRSIDKELTLESPYPSVEGPLELLPLNRVMEGGWIEPEEQEAVAVDARRKGIDDALAEMVGGDRRKARELMSAGPVKLDGRDFAIYLGKQLLEATSIFDRKHMDDPQRLAILCNEASEAAAAALKLLKDNPDGEREKAAKKLQDDVKTALGWK